MHTRTHTAAFSRSGEHIYLVTRSPFGSMDEATRRFDKEVVASLVRPPVALRPIAAAAASRQALLDMYAMAPQPCRLYGRS